MHLGFILLFTCTCPREVVLGQEQFCLQSNYKRKGVWEWDIWCIHVCVCTYKCYSASVLRSNANKSKLLKSKVAKLHPFSLTDVCFQYTVLRFIHVSWTDFSPSARSVAAGNLRAGQLDVISLYKTIALLHTDISFTIPLFLILVYRLSSALSSEIA